MKRSFPAAHTLLFLILLTMTSRAEWRVGFAKQKITPEKPIPLAGYAARTKPFEKVDQDIFAKGMAMDDGAGTKALIITVDVCTLPGNVVEPVAQRLAKEQHLKRNAIIIGCSHSHSGPQISLKGPEEGNITPELTEGIVAYTRGLQEKLFQIGQEALRNLGPAELSFGQGLVHFPMNRREPTPRGVILGVNARGFADRSVPVLCVKDSQGKIRGVLFVCACHGTTMPSNHLGLSGDYAGYAQHFIEEKFPGAQAMFMMGCGGDANPYPRVTSLDLAEQHGRELAEEIARVLGTKLQPINGNLTCAMEQVALPLEKVDRGELEKRAAGSDSLRAGSAKTILKELKKGQEMPREYKAPAAVWQFGTNITWVALSGEVVSGYVPLIERAIGPLNLVVTGYCHDVFGYFPTAQVLKEGGYETRGLFSGDGWFAPEAESVLVGKVRDLAQKAGRKLPDR
jgi:neutral ceramidase